MKLAKVLKVFGVLGALVMSSQAALAASEVCQFWLTGTRVTKALAEEIASSPWNKKIKAVVIVDVRRLEDVPAYEFAAAQLEATFQRTYSQVYQVWTVEGRAFDVKRAIVRLNVAWAGLRPNENVFAIFGGRRVKKGATSSQSSAPESETYVSPGELEDTRPGSLGEYRPYRREDSVGPGVTDSPDRFDNYGRGDDVDGGGSGSEP